jgi:hypothetical protein
MNTCKQGEVGDKQPSSLDLERDTIMFAGLAELIGPGPMCPPLFPFPRFGCTESKESHLMGELSSIAGVY